MIIARAAGIWEVDNSPSNDFVSFRGEFQFCVFPRQEPRVPLNGLKTFSAVIRRNRRPDLRYRNIKRFENGYFLRRIVSAPVINHRGGGRGPVVCTTRLTRRRAQNQHWTAVHGTRCAHLMTIVFEKYAVGAARYDWSFSNNRVCFARAVYRPAPENAYRSRSPLLFVIFFSLKNPPFFKRKTIRVWECLRERHGRATVFVSGLLPDTHTIGVRDTRPGSRIFHCERAQ